MSTYSTSAIVTKPTGDAMQAALATLTHNGFAIINSKCIDDIGKQRRPDVEDCIRPAKNVKRGQWRLPIGLPATQ